MVKSFYKNPKAVEAIYDLSEFLYSCVEQGDLQEKEIRNLLFLAKEREKEKGDSRRYLEGSPLSQNSRR